MEIPCKMQVTPQTAEIRLRTDSGCSCATTGGAHVGLRRRAPHRRSPSSLAANASPRSRSFLAGMHAARLRTNDGGTTRRRRIGRHDRRAHRRRRRRRCATTFAFTPASGTSPKSVSVSGEWDGFTTPATLTGPDSSGAFSGEGPARARVGGRTSSSSTELAARSEVDDAQVRHRHRELRGARSPTATRRRSRVVVAIERQGPLQRRGRVRPGRRANANRHDDRDGHAPKRLHRQADRRDGERHHDQRRRAEPRRRQVHDLRERQGSPRSRDRAAPSRLLDRRPSLRLARRASSTWR